MPFIDDMQIKTHCDFSEIDEAEWNALLQHSSTNVPFLSYGYLKSWWEFKGGGEWPEGKLAIISARIDGKLTGIAPFFATIHEGSKKLLFLGSIEISDYLDLIVETGAEEAFSNALLPYLKEQFPEVQEILLYNLPENSPNLALLEKAAHASGWSIQSERAYHTPIISLTGDWEAYLSGVDKKQRHEIRRKLRRAEESADSIGWYIVNEKEQLDREIEEFFNLMAHDEEKQRFLTPGMRKQMHSIIRWAFDSGVLQLAFFTVRGEKAASYLCLDYRERIWVYNSGFDPQFREYSPGWVLLAYLIRHAIQNGKREFDFMRGDEEYKYRFGAADAFVLKARLNRP